MNNKLKSVARKLIVYLNCLFFLFFLFSNPVVSVWNKYQNNPIISSLTSPWNNPHNPTILKLPNGYLMIIEANNGHRWKLLKATSDNDVSNWIVSNEPLIPTDTWDTEHSNPSILNISPNQYSFYFTAFNSFNWQIGPDRYRLGLATSIDTNLWEKYNNWVLYGSSDHWDSGGIARGLSLLLLNGTYHLWYTGTNDNNLASNPYWRIGYATSTDGINWTKQNNGNPVIEPTQSWELNNVSYPHVLYEDGIFKMWYAAGSGDMPSRFVYAESPDGINWTKPASKNPALTGTAGTFDSTGMSSPSIIRDDDLYKMWYSGFNGSIWSIGFATESAVTVTPTPTPIPPTPTPTPFDPVVVVPGTFASWNKEAILEGQNNPVTPWTLLSFVKEYDGIIQTLKNLGYTQNSNLFIWPYDWRKSIVSTVTNFDSFIDNTVVPANPGRKLQLVGHSLGGLIARAWTQTDTNKDIVKHVVTLGSPHQGILQPYKAWEGGDISQDNTIMTYAARMLLELNRRNFASSRETVQSVFPVLKDLLPTSDYLLNQSTLADIPESSMTIRNTWLSGSNFTVSSIFPILDAITGTGLQAPQKYIVTTPSWLNTALGNWVDGKPVDTQTGNGDGTVLSARAQVSGDSATSLSLSHANLIASSDSINTILNTLEIPHTSSDITAGSQTVLSPSLLFLIRSPAIFTVVHNGSTYPEQNGIVLIPDATNGNYVVTITGTGTGVYHFTIGQFIGNNYSWHEYTGQTSPGNQTSLTIQFSSTQPLPDPIIGIPDKDRLDEINLKLTELAALTSNSVVLRARTTVKTLIYMLSRRNYREMRRLFEQLMFDLSTIRKTNPSESAKQKTYEIGEKIIDAESAIFGNKPAILLPGELNTFATLVNSLTNQTEQKLQLKAQNNTLTQAKAKLLDLGKFYKSQGDAHKLNGLSLRAYSSYYLAMTLFRESVL